MSFSRPLVLSGPSGVGKSTLLQRLFADVPNTFGFSVSHTTRHPRPGEVHGTHYYFVDRPTFLSKIARGDFLEHAEFSGNFYGTSYETVRTIQGSGKRCILDIDAQGVKQVKEKALTDPNFDAVFCFVAPPSVEALRTRLRGRGTDDDTAVQKRLNMALTEIAYAKEPGVHDYVIVNDDVARAYALLRPLALGETGGFVGDEMPPLDD